MIRSDSAGSPALYSRLRAALTSGLIITTLSFGTACQAASTTPPTQPAVSPYLVQNLVSDERTIQSSEDVADLTDEELDSLIAEARAQREASLRP